jgi:hypothetical protein
MLQLVIKANDFDSCRRYCLARGIEPIATAQKKAGEVLALVEKRYSGAVEAWFCTGRDDAPFALGTLLLYSVVGG